MPEHFPQEWMRLTNDVGDVLELRGTLHMTEHDGLGLVRPRRHTRSGPQQHGQTLAAAYLESRVITIRTYAQTASEPGLQEQRDIEAFMLNNLNVSVHLDVMMPSGTVRRLDVLYLNGWTAPRTARDPYHVQADVVQLIADDPVLYETALHVETFVLDAAPLGIFVPMFIPLFIGPGMILETRNITYPGTWRSFPVITITGPATFVRIDNLITGEFLHYPILINAGDFIEINTQDGFKTVENSVGTNMIENLDEDSDLATFHIAPHAEALDGINQFRVSALSTTAATSIAVEYRVRWLST